MDRGAQRAALGEENDVVAGAAGSRGPAARVAVDSTALLAFVKRHTDYRLDPASRRWRRLVNGRPVAPADARTLRRWRQTPGVTLWAGRGLLGRYGLSWEDFTYWADLRGTPALLHDRRAPLAAR